MKFKTLLLFFSCIFGAMQCCAETFQSLTPTTCPTSSNGLFTTGQQYVDPNNGVLLNSWSMLVRWQGNPTVGNTQWVSDPLQYNAGAYTGYTPPTPYSAWQRGYQPENQVAATPGVQLHGCQAGMLINTWYYPRTSPAVSGGYFNDMYGYAWNPNSAPWAFEKLVLKGGGFVAVPSELVLQGTLAIPQIAGYYGKLVNGSWNFSPATNLHDASGFGHIQYSLFAYIKDTSHPNLHPIAILSTIFENSITTPTYQCPSKANILWDYATSASELGVWATSSGVCTTDTTTVRYTGGYTTGTPFSTPEFFRIHITPQNLTNMVNRINSLDCGGGAGSCNCTPGVSCPNIGYSTAPANYDLEYMGVILELAPCDTNSTGVHCSTNLPAITPTQDSNLGAAVSALDVGAFNYTNP